MKLKRRGSTNIEILNREEPLQKRLVSRDLADRLSGILNESQEVPESIRQRARDVFGANNGGIFEHF